MGGVGRQSGFRSVINLTSIELVLTLLVPTFVTSLIQHLNIDISTCLNIQVMR